MLKSIFVRTFLCAALISGAGGAWAQENTPAQSVKALLEQADAFRSGSAGPRNRERALQLYEQAIEKGSNLARYRVAELYLEMGEARQAITMFESAAALGSKSSEARLAEAHARGLLGDLSDPAKGIPELERLAQAEGGERAQYTLARLHAAGIGTQRDEGKALSIYRSLAEQGHAGALRQLGRMHQSGSGMPRDSDEAMRLFRRAIEAGSGAAYSDLGSALIDAGSGAEALDVFMAGRAKGMRSAEAEIANGHYLGLFGAASRRAQGQQDLKRLAEAGDVTAIQHALINHERRSRRIANLDLERVLGHLETAVASGDENATRALARAYRKLYWLIPQNREKHAALVRDFGHQLGERHGASERISALYDHDDHNKSRNEALRLLQSTRGQGYKTGALRLRSVEQQAFVYFLQHEMADLGYYSGPKTGFATRSTIAALLDFCQDEGIYDSCIHGPLVYENSVRILDALMARKSG